MGPILAALDPAVFDKVLFPAIADSLDYFGPEFQVACAAMAIFLLDVFIPRKYSKHLAWLALVACLWPSLSVLEIYGVAPRALFLGMTALDPFANFFKLFFLLGTIPIILLAYLSKEFEGLRMGEFYGILLSAVFAGMLMASSNHLLMAFMSLELLSICSYILVGYFKEDRRGSEAALKYIIYGSVAAGIMGYGLSLFYGLTGSGEFGALARLLEGIEPQAANVSQLRITLTVALLLTFAGLAYKMATIPMHFWCPDVYEGAPTTITAFLSVGSKAAGFALTIRFLDALNISETVPGLASAVSWPMIMIVVSIFTMTLGNFAALWQDNLKRMLAYSSIAHAGYMMMGMAILHEKQYPGAGLIAYYLLAYLAMNLGAFAVVILIENKLGSVDVEAYRGLGKRAPFLSVALTLFLFSLIGIPPTAGFAGKYMLFQGVLEAARVAGSHGWPFYLLAAAAVVNTAISVYYYARIVKNLYLVEPAAGEAEAGTLKFPVLGTSLVAVFLLLTFLLFFLLDGVGKATRDLKIFS